MGVLVDLYAGASAHTSLANGSTFSVNQQSVNSNLQNSALLVCIVDDSALGTSFQCNWDTAGANQLMTSIATFAVAGIGNLFFFGLAIPTPGSKTLGVKRTSGATSNCDVFSVSLYNADQVLANWSASSNTSTGTAASSATVSVGSRPGAYAFSIIGTITTLPSGPTGGTARFGPDTLTACVGKGADTTASTTSVIHTYTLSPSDSFVALMIDINPVTPWGFDSNTSIGGATALLEPRIRKRYAGTKGKSGFALLQAQLPVMDWSVQQPPPPQPNRPRRAAAIMIGDAGIQAALNSAQFNFGGQIQSWQPPAFPRPRQRYAATKGKSEFPVFSTWYNWGQEIQAWQPPHPAPEKRAAGIMRGDDGMEAKEIRVFNWGFEIQSHQPQHQRPERSGAIAKGDEGIEIPPSAQKINWGFDAQPWQPPVPYGVQSSTWVRLSGATATGDSGIEFPKINFFRSGWEIQSVQPPHPYREKRGSILYGDDGIEQILLQPPIKYLLGFEQIVPLLNPQPPTAQRYSAIKGKSEFAIFSQNFTFFGFDAQSWQPPHPRPEKIGSIVFGDTGIENILLKPPLIYFEFQHPQQRFYTTINQRGAGAAGESTFAASSTGPVGWEIQSWQPPHPRPEKFGAIVRGIDGTEAKEIPFLGNWGFEIQSVQPPAFTRPRYGAIVPKEDGIYPPLRNFYPPGWEIPSFQVRNQMRLRSGILAGQINIEFPENFPAPPAGWEIPSFQAPYNRTPSHFGAMVPGSSVEIPFQNWYNVGFEVQPVQPPHPHPEWRGAILHGDEGIENTYLFVPLNPPPTWGIEAPPVHYRVPYYRAGILPIEPGIEGVYLFNPIAPPTFGIEVSPTYSRVPFNRSAAIARGDEGIEATKINWFNAGWEIPPPQLHKYPERRGAYLRGDEGILASLIPPVAGSGWEIQPPPPPHQFRERRGAFLRGDEGIEQTFFRWLNTGWEIAPVQPPHPRPERAGAIMPIEPGIEAVYVFVAPPVLANDFVQDQTIDLRSPMLAVARGAILLFDGLGLPFFPGPTPPPPFTGGGAAKVIGLDADFGGADVTRVFLSRVPSNLFVGDAIAVIIGVGGDLNLHSSYRMVFTKPDGTQFHIDSPNTYVGIVDAPTRQGTFAAQTYTICVLSGPTVDQHGTWTCFLEAPEFTSSAQQFYIGPPPMLQ